MTIDEPNAEQRDLRSFGRRRGRKRSARQARIFDTGLKRWGVQPADALDPISPADFFQPGPTLKQVWLEIGFGGGEHLLWQAKQHPDIGFIGAEPFEDGVVKVLTAIEEQSLANIRVLPEDVRPLLTTLMPQSIDRVFVLFPDPWPKARHVKRRLISKTFLDALSVVMKPNAELRIATDIQSYAREILLALHLHPQFKWVVKSASDWQRRPPDWPETRYEQKAIRAGRFPNFFTFRHLGAGKAE